MIEQTLDCAWVATRLVAPLSRSDRAGIQIQGNRNREYPERVQDATGRRACVVCTWTSVVVYRCKRQARSRGGGGLRRALAAGLRTTTVQKYSIARIGSVGTRLARVHFTLDEVKCDRASPPGGVDEGSWKPTFHYFVSRVFITVNDRLGLSRFLAHVTVCYCTWTWSTDKWNFNQVEIMATHKGQPRIIWQATPLYFGQDAPWCVVATHDIVRVACHLA
jgi:hypothetical protein